MNNSEAPGPELIISHTGQVFPLGQEPITLGAADDNLIILADPEVSSHHATISWQPELNSYVIEDLGAGNTYINERPVEGEVQLRHGDVLRVGNTIIDVRLDESVEAVPVIAEEPAEEPAGNIFTRYPLLIGLAVVLLAGFTILCCITAGTLLFTGGDGGELQVAILSPSDGDKIAAGSQITLQATASGVDDITVLEMSVNGTLVASTTSPDASGQSSLSVNKPWAFTAPGEYTISTFARTASDSRGKSVSVDIEVLRGEEGQPSTSTPAPIAPTNTPFPDATLTPRPSETVAPPPQIDFFQANPATINAGDCTTLQWGTVSNATEASIAPDVGGVGTPGNTTVCPAETTTYVLTAQGLGGQTQASTVVTVISALPDLVVDTILFDPNPATVGEDNEVKITIRNAGSGAAGPFNWEWLAGTESHFDGRLRGLNAGESTVVTVRWTPAAAYARLDTVARVDINNEVAEIDENNNETWTTIQVVEAVIGPTTVTLVSEQKLDGWQANDGSGNAQRDVSVGNGLFDEDGTEIYWRGFMSFDLSEIPSSAIIDSVELRFYQASIGGDPYGKLGSLILDQVDYGTRLNADAFDTPTINSAGLARQTAPKAWYIFNSPLFSNWLEQSLASGQGRFQLRLRWQQETDGDGQEDYAGIESLDNYWGSNNPPQLIITYTP